MSPWDALADTEVTTSLHSGTGWRRTAIGFEAGNAIEVAAPQVSVHSDCIPERFNGTPTKFYYISNPPPVLGVADGEVRGGLRRRRRCPAVRRRRLQASWRSRRLVSLEMSVMAT